MVCKQCGSGHVRLMRKGYRPGCGCLGVLLFGWIGLLLGFLGSSDVEMVCDHCGFRRPVQLSDSSSCGGGCLLLIIILFLLMFVL